MAAVKKKANNS